jgi:hypothetical protein
MNDNALKQVPKCKYKGSMFTGDGKNKEGIIKRIKGATAIFNKNKQLLYSNNFILEIKEAYKNCIWSVAVCGSETRTLG